MSKTINSKSIEKHANKIICDLSKENINTYYNRMPFETIQVLLKNHVIIKYPMYSKLSGMSFEIEGYDCILINSADDLCRQNFSCWHEYFHTLRKDPKNQTLAEQEANYFAGCMLVPKSQLKTYLLKNNLNKDSLKLIDLIKLQIFFQCSLDVIIIRLKQIYGTSKYFKHIKISENKSNIIDIFKQNNLYDDNYYLINSTNDTVISKNVIDSIMDSIKNRTISVETANKIYDLIIEKEVKFQ